MQIKKVLLIAYKFPPYTGVGARRWAKFAKYFAANGIEVHVVTTNWHDPENLSLLNDVKRKNISIHVINTTSLTLQEKIPFAASFIKKITFFLRYKIFNWLDEGHYWTIIAKSKIEKIIKENNITHLIATGAPFSINCLASDIKKENLQLKVIQDLRDPWTDSPYINNLQGCIEAENKMLTNVDAIVSVTETLTARYKLKNLTTKAIFKTITNGYDEDDKSNTILNKKIEFSKDKINISYFGILAVGRGHQLNKLIEALGQIENFQELPIRFNIFGEDNSDFVNEIKNGIAGSLFRFYPYLPNTEVQHFMKESDIHFSINAESFPYAFGTKIFDAFLYRKPTLLLSPKGDLSKLITENNLGYFTDGSIENTINVIKEIQNDFKIQKWKDSKNKIFENYSLNNLTKNYINFISNI